MDNQNKMSDSELMRLVRNSKCSAQVSRDHGECMVHGVMERGMEGLFNRLDTIAKTSQEVKTDVKWFKIIGSGIFSVMIFIIVPFTVYLNVSINNLSNDVKLQEQRIALLEKIESTRNDQYGNLFKDVTNLEKKLEFYLHDSSIQKDSTDGEAP